MAESLEDRVARLSERADRSAAPPWTPTDTTAGHPSAIAGVVVEVGVKHDAGYEKKQTVTTVTIRTVEGDEWCVWCFGKLLDQELARAPLGSVVAVTYKGRKQGRDAEYHDYRVVVDVGELPSGSAPLTPRPPAPPVEQPPVDEPPATSPSVECEACGFAGGKHAAGCPSKPEPPAPSKCEACGFLDGHHRDGCPNDIPF